MANPNPNQHRTRESDYDARKRAADELAADLRRGTGVSARDAALRARQIANRGDARNPHRSDRK